MNVLQQRCTAEDHVLSLPPGVPLGFLMEILLNHLVECNLFYSLYFDILAFRDILNFRDSCSPIVPGMF